LCTPVVVVAVVIVVAVEFQLREKRIPAKIMSVERWGVKVISIHWLRVLGCWEQCNLDEHNKSDTMQQTKWKTKLLIEVKFLQEANPPTLHVDKDWFDLPITELYKLPVPSLLAWIRNARQLMKINRKEFDASL
jgi:hypothetical protein